MYHLFTYIFHLFYMMCIIHIMYLYVSFILHKHMYHLFLLSTFFGTECEFTLTLAVAAQGQIRNPDRLISSCPVRNSDDVKAEKFRKSCRENYLWIPHGAHAYRDNRWTAIMWPWCARWSPEFFTKACVNVAGDISSFLLLISVRNLRVAFCIKFNKIMYA